MTRDLRARSASQRNTKKPFVKESLVADLGFVVLTVVLFAALAVLIRAVERW
jgi:hypothetical protein